MLLSQLRWLMALAIGVIIMMAVWFEPDDPAPGVQPRPPAPLSSPPAPPGPPPLVTDWPERLNAYRGARASLIANTPEGAVREAALASLRQQYFRPEEIERVEALDREARPGPSGTDR